MALLLIPLGATHCYLNWKLVVILNPIFDPKFKVNLGKWTWVSVSNRAARAGFYALGVASPRFRHSFIKTAVDYDFRSKVDAKTFRLCRLYVLGLYIWMFAYCPVAVIVMVRNYLSS